MPFISFVPPRRKRVQEAMLSEAQDMYRNRVSKAEAIARIREMARVDKRALKSIDSTAKSPRGSHEYRALSRLFYEASGKNEQFDVGPMLSQVEESLMSMPSAEAFSILAIQEPKLRALEQKAVQLSTDIALSGKTREEMPLLLMKEINGLLDPHARTSNGILSSPIAKLIVSRHIFKLAGFVEFMEYKDWWPGGP